MQDIGVQRAEEGEDDDRGEREPLTERLHGEG